MQNIKLIIKGNFWDTQIYSKKLHIFDINGSRFVINWNDLINDFSQKYPNLKTIARISFLESDFFYSKSKKTEHLYSKILFDELAKLPIHIDISKRNKHISHLDNPLPFPHNDSEVYYNELYISHSDGIYKANFTTSNYKKEKLWDGSVLQLSASRSNTSIALAAGSDGLFDMRLDTTKPSFFTKRQEPKKVSPEHCSSCEWSTHNIISSSYISPLVFAAYKKIKKNKKFERILEELIPEHKIFEAVNIEHGFSWGESDKLYMYKNNIISAIKITEHKKSKKPVFKKIKSINIDNDYGDIVSANVAPFGVILEFDERLVIIKSNGEIFPIEGEPVNWRIFTKSRYYKNQLHVIYDDRLEIYSFYHDYFVDQKLKSSGTTVRLKK